MLAHPRLVAVLVLALLVVATQTADVAAVPGEGSEFFPGDGASTDDNGTIRAGP